MIPPERSASERYAAVRFNSAAPIDQRLDLIDGAIAASERVSESLRRRAYDDGHRAASAGRSLLRELMSSVRRDADPIFVNTVARLYVYMHGQLSRAVIQNLPAASDEVTRLLRHERDAWERRRRNPGSGPAAISANAVA
ncbi:MAG: flagellar protein FliS [Phycisphaerae bacterium]|nr:flagellar protein FliS [Phycisphaerae bacterium]